MSDRGTIFYSDHQLSTRYNEGHIMKADDIDQDSSVARKPGFVIYRSQVRALQPTGCFSGPLTSLSLQISGVASEHHSN